MALVLAASACAGVVVEPVDESSVTGITRFWGYATQPGQTLNLEALNTSGTWETVATTTAGPTPTYAGNQTGFYYAVNYNPVTAPVRFRRASPYTGSWARIHFRITTPGLGAAKTRRYYSNGTQPQGIESNLERAWAQHEGSNDVIRIDFHI